VVEHADDEEDDHQCQWARCCLDAEKADQADDGKVATDRDVLQSTRVHEAFGVDIGCVDEEQVVPVRKVEEIESYRCKAKHQGCNTRVRDGDDGQIAILRQPITVQVRGLNNIPDDWKDRSPAQAAESDPTLICLSRCLVEDLP
jgi:hypothetical protein